MMQLENTKTEPEKRPIKVSMLGFDDAQELTRLASLFNHAQRWQQPWQIVEEAEAAEFLLMATDDAQSLPDWKAYIDQFGLQRLIVYSKQPSDFARWHLHRPASGQMPSPLEFTILLKEIGRACADGLPKKLNSLAREEAVPVVNKRFDWRERLKILIVGS